MKTQLKTILKRFLRGAVGGAISSMMLVPLTQPSQWYGFQEILNALAMAGLFGFVTGLLLALDKWARWTEEK